MTEKNPWDHLRPHDIARFGDVVLDKEERMRWCGAILTGGLPLMWDEARAIRELIYTRLQLKASDRVLLVGESNESAGFEADIRSRIGQTGDLTSIDIIERARDMCFQGLRGKNGKLGTWRYDYTDGVPDNYYDAIAIMQGVQHCEDWVVGAKELLRTLKSGRMIVLAEIAHGPYLIEKARVDVHLEYYIRKLYMGTDQRPEDFSYWCPSEIERSFSGLVTDTGSFEERGFEIFWGRKPT